MRKAVLGRELKAHFEQKVGRPSYMTIQDGWAFGYWFMGNDHSYTSEDAEY